jgi:Tol biopolymer transport system component
MFEGGRTIMRSLVRRILVLIVVLIAAASLAEAQQYFGRNKVQYRKFDFQVLKTDHFDIYYYPEEKAAVEQAGRMAERWYARLSRLLGHRFGTRQAVILYGSHPEFEQTNAIAGELGEGTGGVTEILKRRVVLPFAGPLAETDHVLGHELVHAFQFDIGGLHGNGAVDSPSLRLPLWFVEGMAEYLSLGPIDAHTAMWMRDAARREKLPTIRQLNDPRYFPYRYGQALWAYIGGRWGDETVGRILKRAGRAGNAESAIEEVVGVKIDDLSKQWHEAIRATYRSIAESKRPPTEYGRALITEKNAGELNIAPALSPDGRRIVFLSERGLFSIDVYLADAQTGRIIRHIVKTAVDPHFESLQFINSSGAWDRQGRRFAFGTVQKGRPYLSILDVESGRIARDVRLGDLGEVFSPSWSPDGNRIVFSAIAGGLTDLYLYDLKADKRQRLTNDAFADLQPVWSPDGRTIAFSTDRFSTRLAELEIGEYRLALLDPESGQVRPGPGFERAKNIDPQWSDDGRSLYFISDRGGISNVYRARLDGGEITQVTDLVTGVSGITHLSPALSTGAGRLVYCVYEDGKYNIYSIDSAERLAGGPLSPPPLVNAAMLPPQERKPSEVVSLTERPTYGLPDQGAFRTADYKPHLSLDYVGQPSVGVGVDRFGTYAGGNVSLFWSDMLGDHNVGAVLQVNGQFRDIGGVVAYENRAHRMNWTAAVEQIPYVTGSFAQGFDPKSGAFVEQAELFRQTDRAVSLTGAYPFSRASRFEVGAAARSISFSHEIETDFFDQAGNLIGHERQKLGSLDSLYLGQGVAALVHDTSIFGATSPILGRRFRFEAAPTFGSVNYTGLLADYRHYVMPVRPYTFALRALYYGRHGSGGGDPRLTPLFIGYPELVRGYDINSFSASECGNDPSVCPAFDRLLGTRMLIGNLELRFPPFGALGGKGLYGPVPIELLAFGDAGLAWNSGEHKSFNRNTTDFRRPVTSAGFGARVNVFGYAVVEVDFVRPFDRPREGWLWEFNFRPGF